VKKLRVYRSLDRLNGNNREARRPAVGPMLTSELPLTRVESVKAFADAASPKSPRRP